MRRTVLTMILAGSISLYAVLCRAGEPQNIEIETVIQSQIEALRRDDFATAFEFASPNIQGLFGTPDRFGQMVRQGYPMVWRPAEVTYLELRRENGAYVQQVMVRDLSGAIHVLDYYMIETEAGWQINGVHILSRMGVGT